MIDTARSEKPTSEASELDIEIKDDEDVLKDRHGKDSLHPARFRTSFFLR